MTSMKNIFFPLKSILAKAYPAVTATKHVSALTDRLITKLFLSHRNTSDFSRTVLRFFNVKFSSGFRSIGNVTREIAGLNVPTIII